MYDYLFPSDRLLQLAVTILKEKLINNALERTILRERVYNAALDFFRFLPHSF